MKIFPLSKRLERYIEKRKICELFQKQCSLFSSYPLHPSLHVELLEPRHLRVYSFRITKKYRAIFIYRGNDVIEIVDINNHYS